MIFIIGIAIAHDVDQFLRRFGKQNYIRLVEMLDPEDQKIFFGKIIAADLYPLDPYIKYIELGNRLFYDSDRTFFLKNTEDIIDRQLKGVFRWFVKFGSPGFVTGEIVKITQAYFEGITVHPVIQGNGRFVGRIKGFKKSHQILEYAIIAFFKKALEISGAKNVQALFTIPFSDDKDYSEIAVSWGVEIIL